MTGRDYRFQFDCHVVSRALYFALHDEHGALRVAPWRCPERGERFSDRALEWRDSVEAVYSR